MTSDQIRGALTKMHQTRGQLMAFCNTHKLNYNLIIKFLNDPKRQLWHDNAQRIIDALPEEYRLEEGAA